MSKHAEILKLLESSMSDAEFDRCVENHKLLYDCKTKGFKNLEIAGLIQHPSTSERFGKDESAEIAEQASRLVNDGKMTVASAAKEIGVSTGVLRYHVRKNEAGMSPKRGRPTDVDPKKADKAIKLINNKGYRYSEACRMLGISRVILRTLLTNRGMRYDAKLIRVEAVK